MLLSSSEKGQSLVEYALILILAGAIVIGILGFGFAYVWNLLLVPIGVISIVWWQAILIWFVLGIVVSILVSVISALRRSKIVIVVSE